MTPTEKPAGTPPGEFVNDDLERDCARFLAELKARTTSAEGFGPPAQK